MRKIMLCMQSSQCCKNPPFPNPPIPHCCSSDSEEEPTEDNPRRSPNMTSTSSPTITTLDHSLSRDLRTVSRGHRTSPCPPLRDRLPTPSSQSTSKGKEPAAISLRANILGLTTGLSLSATLYLLLFRPAPNPLWRAPLFILTLSIFHFLEFYTTAVANPPFATVSAFLLSQNGSAYAIANTCALIECILHYTLFPNFKLFSPGWRGAWFQTAWLSLGFTGIIAGQVIRTTAMISAGTNFNHRVQVRKRVGHELVTGGIYSLLRHPSYFGFFWWGLGTQVVSGNSICLVGYALVLWKFFKERIESESSSTRLEERKSIRGRRDLGLMQWLNYSRGGRITRGLLWGGICRV